MTLFDFFDWLELTPIGVAIRDSLWLFPAIEAVHLLGLALLGGAVLVLDLRMLGLGLTRAPIAAVAQATRRWLTLAIGVMFLTGIPLLMSEALKCYYNTSFWVKMGALVAALAFTYLVRNPIAMRPERRYSGPALGTRFVALISMSLWFTVAAAGRWIGFS